MKVVEKLCRGGFSLVGMELVNPHESSPSSSLQHSPMVTEVAGCSTRDGTWSCIRDNDDTECGIAVCVQRYNAIWQLCHELRPFCSSLSLSKALKCK